MPPPSAAWLLLQLADSAFPTGGFAHSGGLEAAWQLGHVDRASLPRFFLEALEHACACSLPILGSVYRNPEFFDALDAQADAMLSSQVANRASRAQGAALVAAAAAAFGHPALVALRARSRKEPVFQHLAPVAGLVTRSLGVPADEAARLFAFQALRSLVSSAVRLGAVGPLEAQAMQHRLAGEAEAVVERHASREAEDAAQTSPLLELLQGHHDRLYSKLFSS